MRRWNCLLQRFLSLCKKIWINKKKNGIFQEIIQKFSKNIAAKYLPGFFFPKLDPHFLILCLSRTSNIQGSLWDFLHGLLQEIFHLFHGFLQEFLQRFLQGFSSGIYPEASFALPLKISAGIFSGISLWISVKIFFEISPRMSSGIFPRIYQRYLQEFLLSYHLRFH